MKSETKTEPYCSNGKGGYSRDLFHLFLITIFFVFAGIPNISAQNDLCADAIAISCGQTLSGSTDLATLDNVGTCGTSNTAPGVWYSFLGTGDDITASLCSGTSYDSKISVFEGTCGALVCVDGNDDACGTQSEVTFSSVSGTTYLILVHGFSTNTGAFDLSITCTGPALPPANDDCANAIPIACGETLAGTTDGAAPDNAAAGDCNSVTVTAPGVWYSISGNGDDITANLCSNTAYDSKISVYEGSCGSLICVNANDDFCSLQSEVTFTSVSGTDYLILVHGFSSNSGDFELSISSAACTPTPSNDDCANAIPIACGQTLSGTTSGATADAVGLCGSVSATAPGVWYSFIGTGDDVIVNTCNNPDYDTKISVFEGTCGSLVCVDANDDACGVQSEVSFSSVSGTEYFIYVHGFGAAEGDFDLTVNCITPCPMSTVHISITTDDFGEETSYDFVDLTTSTSIGSVAEGSLSSNTTYDYFFCVDPTHCLGFTINDFFGDGICCDFGNGSYTVSLDGVIMAAGGAFGASESASFGVCTVPNDTCSDAVVITEGLGQPFSNFGATTTGTPDNLCLSFGNDQIFSDLWYSYTASCTGMASFSTVGGTTYDTRVAVYSGSCPGTIVACNDDDAGTFQSTAFWPVTAGTTYLIRLGGFDPIAQGTGTFDLSCSVAATPNDFCSGAIAVSCGTTVTGSTVGALAEGADCGTTVTAPSVWYKITGTGDVITATTCNLGTLYDTKISVYEGTCGSLSCVTGNDDYPDCSVDGLLSSASWLGVSGVDYFILVHGFDDNAGDFELSISCNPPLANDECSGVTPTTLTNGVPVTLTGTTLGATASPDESNVLGAGAVWEAVTLTGSCNFLTIDYCGTDPDNMATAFVVLADCPTTNFLVGTFDFTTCSDANVSISFIDLPAGTYYIPVLADASFNSLGAYTMNVLSEDCPPVPANDNVCSAQALTLGVPTDFYNYSATAETGEVFPGIGTDPSGSCTSQDGWCDLAAFGEPDATNSVWFTFVAPPSGSVLIDAGPFDGQLAIYSVTNCADFSTFTLLAANDDRGPFDLAPQITSTSCIGGNLLTPGQTYYVQFDGFSGTTGAGTITVSELICPANDDCASVTPTTLTNGTPVTFTGSTLGATASAEELGVLGAGAVWEAVTLTGDCNFLTVDYCGTGADIMSTAFVVIADCPTTGFTVGDFNFTDCGDGNVTVIFTGLPAGTYYLPVLADGSINTALGDYTMNVLSEDCPPVPANDNACSAEALTLGVTSNFNNFFATAEAGEVTPGAGTDTGNGTCNATDGWCSFETEVQNSVWFSFVAPATGHVSVEAADFDLQLAVYSATNCGDFASYTKLGANDDSNPNGNFSPYVELSCLMPGQTYYVQVDGYNGATGYGTVLVNDLGPSSLVTDFMLVNANADTDIRPMVEGDVLNLYTLPGINIRADVCIPIGSLVFELNGTVVRTESAAPYALAGDHPTGDYQTWYTTPGSYTLIVTPYSGAYGGGVQIGTPDTIHFTVVNAPEDCVGVPNGTAVTDIYGNCCQPGDLDCAGVCFGGATQGSAYLRVLNTSTSWRKLKLGNNPNSLWTPLVDVTDGGNNNMLCVTLRDPNGTVNWNKIMIRALGAGVTVGNYSTSIGTNWTQVCIPLSAFGGVNFGAISVLEIPYSNGHGPFEIDIQRVEFTGGPNPYLWFGEPKTDNINDGQSGSGSALFCELVTDDCVPGPGCVDLVLNLTTDNFGNETSVELYDMTGDTILFMVPSGTFDDNTSYVQTLCVDPAHCYEATIFDSFGDGICCAEGNGSYSVTYNGLLIAAGGAFAFDESVTFGGGCASPKTSQTNGLATSNNPEMMMDVYPNPFRDQITFEFVVVDDSPVSLELYNITGEKVATVFEGNATGGELYQFDLNTSNLASGFYLYKLQTNAMVKTEKITLAR